MYLKDQLNLTILTNTTQKKEDERKRKEKQEKLRLQSQSIIDERLTNLLLEVAKTSCDSWLRIEATKFSYNLASSIYDAKVAESLELINGYIITVEDVKKFCKKNKFKLRYEYVYESTYYRKKFGNNIYMRYKGNFLPEGLLRICNEYFHAYFIFVS